MYCVNYVSNIIVLISSPKNNKGYCMALRFWLFSFGQFSIRSIESCVELSESESEPNLHPAI